MADNMQATPQSRPGLGALASLLKRADDFGRKPFGYDNPPVQVLSDLLGIPGTQRTLERLAYGEPLTTGAGQATRVRDDTVDALFNAPGPLAKLALATKGLPIGAVIKPKGGNWLDGSVEEALKGLRNNRVEDQAYLQAMRKPEVREPYGAWLEQKVSENPAYQRIPGIQAFNQFSKESGFPALSVEGPEASINSWIDKTLTKYVKNDMATPEDPIRLMAEKYAAQKPDLLAKAQAKIDALNAKGAQLAAQRGVPETYLTQHRQEVIAAEKAKKLIELREGVHYEPYGFDAPRLSTQLKRQNQKTFPPAQAVLAESDTARRWENASDAAVASAPMAEYQDFGSSNLTREQPWLSKLDPETPMYRYDRGASVDELGFSHLIDELRNATNPESGLPKELLLDYEKLHKMTMPQIVDRVADINAWRAAQKAEADFARANNAATVLHKEYPEGYRWVELKKPDFMDPKALEALAGYEKDPRFKASLGDNLKNRAPKLALEDALKYEGDTMGHCVGGYCDDVASGKSKIYSLRDAKGKPHVTIEVRPNPPKYNTDTIPNQEIPQEGFRVEQIKGKGNRAPKDEYLPFVQDFVKSGKWSDVGDLQNTGLVKSRDIFGPTELDRFKANSIDLPNYLDDAERKALQDRWYTLETGNDPATGLPRQ